MEGAGTAGGLRLWRRVHRCGATHLIEGDVVVIVVVARGRSTLGVGERAQIAAIVALVQLVPLAAPLLGQHAVDAAVALGEGHVAAAVDVKRLPELAEPRRGRVDAGGRGAGIAHQQCRSKLGERRRARFVLTLRWRSGCARRH